MLSCIELQELKFQVGLRNLNFFPWKDPQFPPGLPYQYKNPSNTPAKYLGSSAVVKEGLGLDSQRYDLERVIRLPQRLPASAVAVMIQQEG